MERPLVLVGMSGVGKSFTAAALGREGREVIDCDARIGERLSELVPVAPGDSPVIALGRWMGLPSSAGYREREARYLALEEEITRDALDRARTARFVIDTTGSVVHLSPVILERLRSRGHVRYLSVSPEREAEMLARYLAEPKPVVFGSAWRGEGDDLARAYAELLRWRAAKYEALAHETVPGFVG